MPRHMPLMIALAVLAWVFVASPALTEVAAGIAIFLFGMLMLERGFRTFTGGTLERLLQRSTDRVWKSLAFGAVTTTLTQSSTLVSVITISFLSAGLMNLGQGMGVIFGANLGTTSGAWLIASLGLKVNVGALAMPLLTVGVLLSFNRARTIKGVGHVLTGIGFLLLGIFIIIEGFERFQDALDLSRFAVSGLQGLLLYTLLGIIATAILQSSHATLLLTIAALAAGQITYDNALALSIGANVGTTLTAVLSAIGANIEGRRLAGAHLIFNVITGLIALVFMPVFLVVVDTSSGWLGISPDNHTLKLALFHTLFNLTGIILMVPFIPFLVGFLEARLKSGPVVANQPKYINERTLDMPGAAMEATRRELLRLFRRTFSLIAGILNFKPGQLRKSEHGNPLPEPPATIEVIDVDEVYLQRIKPLHGLILDFLARIPVEGKRAQQLVMLRVATRELVAAVKDAKHLQKNLVRYLNASNPHLREQYRGLRLHLGVLLNRLDRLAASSEPIEHLELELAELASEIEKNDLVSNGRLDELIRHRQINAEQATSLMNDNAYAYRIATNLVAMARAIFVPYEEIDAELREQLTLEPTELRNMLSEPPETPSKESTS